MESPSRSRRIRLLASMSVGFVALSSLVALDSASSPNAEAYGSLRTLVTGDGPSRLAESNEYVYVTNS